MDRAIAEYADAVKFHSSWQRVAGDDQPPFESLVTLGPAFEELAHRVIEPMLAHRELVQGGEGQ